MTDTFPSVLYRLRGGWGGTDCFLELLPGEHTLGSSRKNAFILPDTSVSRTHALLRVGAGTLVVEDLDSTNGTFVDGERVQRSFLRVGAELRLGRCRLRLEEAMGLEADLAIDLLADGHGSNAPSDKSSSTEPGSSTLADDPTTRDFWIDRVEMFLRCLASAEGDLERSLALLGSSLQAEGCSAIRWHEQEAVVLASWGRLGGVPPLKELEGGMLGGGSGVRTVLLPTKPLTSVTLFTPAAREPVGLVLLGDFLGRSSASSGLAILGRILGLFLRAEQGLPAEPLPPQPRVAALVFPAGYRPGNSPPMLALYAQMQRLLHGDLPVLIHGETGSGKELIARILHDSSDRREGPFVAVNCAAIPRELLEAEMFGVGRGVATGVDPRRGKFELADGGTLFLDEVCEMASELQPKLLRALQENEIQPLGGPTRGIDVRVISATNIDLENHLAAGDLRSDLYYRLAGFVLAVPPLRRCPEDISGLVEHFLRDFSRRYGVAIRGLTVSALRRLTDYPWPGNIRELENYIGRLVLLAKDGQVLQPEHLPDDLQPPGTGAPTEAVEQLIAEHSSLKLAPAVRLLEECIIRTALGRTGGVKTEACRLLGLSRNGLDNKLKRLGIRVERSESTIEGRGR